MCKQISSSSSKNKITRKLYAKKKEKKRKKWLMFNCDCYIAIFETI